MTVRNTETEKSPKEIAERIAEKFRPRFVRMNADSTALLRVVHKALRAERERAARIAETVHADKTFDVDSILRAEIASAIRGKRS